MRDILISLLLASAATYRQPLRSRLELAVKFAAIEAICRRHVIPASPCAPSCVLPCGCRIIAICTCTPFPPYSSSWILHSPTRSNPSLSYKDRPGPSTAVSKYTIVFVASASANGQRTRAVAAPWRRNAGGVARFIRTGLRYGGQQDEKHRLKEGGCQPMRQGAFYVLFRRPIQQNHGEMSLRNRAEARESSDTKS